MNNIDYKTYYAELAKKFGEGACTYRFIEEGGKETVYLCVPNEDHRPLTDEEIEWYNALVDRVTGSVDILKGVAASSIRSGLH